jgi:hypothetical protein
MTSRTGSFSARDRRFCRFSGSWAKNKLGYKSPFKRRFKLGFEQKKILSYYLDSGVDEPSVVLSGPELVPSVGALVCVDSGVSGVLELALGVEPVKVDQVLLIYSDTVESMVVVSVASGVIAGLDPALGVDVWLKFGT